ncbi:MAG: acyl-CoA dehydrogenase [Rhodospirillales bacterium]|nr:acyl-CoA dehydrogenase [Rhodospirillales bacterium]
MSEYRLPLREILFVLDELIGVDTVSGLTNLPQITKDELNTLFETAGKFASEIFAPLNRTGDISGATLKNGIVRTPAGFSEAYNAYCEVGWNRCSANAKYGGQGLPQLINSALSEIWNSTNLSLSLCNTLTQSAINLIYHHGSDEQRSTYLPNLISGQWTGAMAMTEPQAGSDVGAITCLAAPEKYCYRLKGQKNYISWGEHDLSQNIIYLILARTPEAPAGTKGLSLFIVPKFIPDKKGNPGCRNDIECIALEKKLGIHASPTCVMNFGSNEGALGWLVGKPHNGLTTMFTMMNTARLAIGHEALGIAERAYQQAKSYAQIRYQGKDDNNKPLKIVEYPDVKRMLLSIKARLEAMRALCYETALSVDLSINHPEEKIKTLHSNRVALLTPIVKAWCSDGAVEITSTNIQIHGGTGYIEDTGAAQLYRDARITPIYEGTNGIQALDLVKRKLMINDGFDMYSLIEEMRQFDGVLSMSSERTICAIRGRFAESGAALSRTTSFILNALKSEKKTAEAAATPYLKLAGIVIGGYFMARAAMIAEQNLSNGSGDNDFYRSKLATSLFYAENILPESSSLSLAATSGAEAIRYMETDYF